MEVLNGAMNTVTATWQRAMMTRGGMELLGEVGEEVAVAVVVSARGEGKDAEDRG